MRIDIALFSLMVKSMNVKSTTPKSGIISLNPHTKKISTMMNTR